MTTTQEQAVALYAELASMTRPLCGECDPPWACCKPHFCNFAKVWAKQTYDVDVVEIGAYEHAPFLLEGDGGCSLEPYQRPMCSAWACEDVLARQSDEWKKRFFDIRNQLRRYEFHRITGIPEELLAGEVPEIVI